MLALILRKVVNGCLFKSYFVVRLKQEASSKGYYVKNKDGGDYEGWCWPGNKILHEVVFVIPFDHIENH